MILYIVVSLFAVILAYISGQTKNSKILVLAFALPTIFLAIRYDFGSDYMGYLEYYQRTVQNNFHDSLTATRFEPGWGFICKLSQPIGFFGLVIVLTIFEMLVFYYMCVKYVPAQYYWLALFILLLNPVLMLTFTSMMRQTLAVSLGLIAIDGIIHQKRIVPLLLIVIATQFHNSAYVLFPVIILSFFSDVKKVFYLLAAFIVAVPILFAFFSDSLVTVFNLLIDVEQFNYYDVYVGEESNNAFGIGDGINLLLLLLLFIFNTRFDNDMRLITVLYAFYIPFFFIVFIAPMISRLSFYFVVLQILCYPNLVRVIKNPTSKMAILILIIPYTFYSLYTCYNSAWGHYFHDYITIFSHYRWL